MRNNHTLEVLRRGEIAFGCAIQSYRSAEILRVFAAAGFDYVFIDMEHGGFDFETVQDMIVNAAHAGITPVVRVGELLYSLVSRLLDVGAQGICFPRVEDPALLAEALTWLKYPPIGKRGYGILPPYIDYEQRSMRDVIAHMNQNTMSVVQFETIAALERADELLSAGEIDIAMIGPADLSIALEIPGELEHPRMIDAIQRLIEQAERHGVIPGIQTRTVEQAAFWAERGMRFVGAGGEHGLLLGAARKAAATLHETRTPATAKG
jgi:2-dehydro-3-deoxyglucarate aldolase/4-hydroxy-2-oxoheptanedioate aldolase